MIKRTEKECETQFVTVLYDIIITFATTIQSVNFVVVEAQKTSFSYFQS